MIIPRFLKKKAPAPKEHVIKIRVWDKEKKTMSEGMELPMLAGYLMAIYPNLGNEVYLQYSGLDDARGKEMYEGDIMQMALKTPDGMMVMTGVLRFNKQKAQFGVMQELMNPLGPSHIELKESEVGRPLVIGNVYENPEIAPKEPA